MEAAIIAAPAPIRKRNRKLDICPFEYEEHDVLISIVSRVVRRSKGRPTKAALTLPHVAI